MKEQYKNIQEFIDDLKKESVKMTIIDMGYLTEDDFIGHKTKCVFHRENDPSLQITDSFFKCYGGCGAKGDIIKFVQLYDDITFLEAIEKLAKHFNATIKDSSISNYTKIQSKLKKEWDGYVEAFNQAVKEGTDHSKKIMEMGKRYFPHIVGYDKEIDYIVLPFTSKTGGILGFTKRIILDEKIQPPHYPKWRHSNLKDSLISNCHNIFNLGMAYKHIKETCEVHIVEGPGDVAAMQRAKFLNTIALCGVGNFSDKVLEILYPLKRIFLVMDGDNAGTKALKTDIKAIMSLNHDLIEETYVVPMREGEDPGILSAKEIAERKDNSQPALIWFIQNSNDTEIRDLYSKCNSQILRPKIINLVAKNMNFTIDQSREWLGAQKTNEKIGDREYYSRLLATIGMNKDISIQALDMTEEQAKRILHLRFKEKY